MYHFASLDLYSARPFVFYFEQYYGISNDTHLYLLRSVYTFFCPIFHPQFARYFYTVEIGNQHKYDESNA